MCLAGFVPLVGSSSKGTTELSGFDEESAVVPDALEMRRQTVDEEIGRGAVVIGISDYKFDNQMVPKGLPTLCTPIGTQRPFPISCCFSRRALAPDHVLPLTDVRAAALPMWEIDITLNRSNQSKKVFVFADACHSAGVAGTKSTSGSARRLNEYMRKLAES